MQPSEPCMTSIPQSQRRHSARQRHAALQRTPHHQNQRKQGIERAAREAQTTTTNNESANSTHVGGGDLGVVRPAHQLREEQRALDVLYTRKWHEQAKEASVRNSERLMCCVQASTMSVSWKSLQRRAEGGTSDDREGTGIETNDRDWRYLQSELELADAVQEQRQIALRTRQEQN